MTACCHDYIADRSYLPYLTCVGLTAHLCVIKVAHITSMCPPKKKGDHTTWSPLCNNLPKFHSK